MTSKTTAEPREWSERLAMYEKLQADQGEHKPFIDREKNTTLFNWESRQRVAFHGGGLDEHQIKELRRIKFDFGKSQQEKWDEMYAQYREHIEENKALQVRDPYKVPHAVNRKLNVWLDTQKRAFRDKSLVRDRLQKLLELDSKFREKAAKRRPHQSKSKLARKEQQSQQDVLGLTDQVVQLLLGQQRILSQQPQQRLDPSGAGENGDRGASLIDFHMHRDPVETTYKVAQEVIKQQSSQAAANNGSSADPSLLQKQLILRVAAQVNLQLKSDLCVAMDFLAQQMQTREISQQPEPADPKPPLQPKLDQRKLLSRQEPVDAGAVQATALAEESAIEMEVLANRAAPDEAEESTDHCHADITLTQTVPVPDVASDKQKCATREGGLINDIVLGIGDDTAQQATAAIGIATFGSVEMASDDDGGGTNDDGGDSLVRPGLDLTMEGDADRHATNDDGASKLGGINDAMDVSSDDCIGVVRNVIKEQVVVANKDSVGDSGTSAMCNATTPNISDPVSNDDASNTPANDCDILIQGGDTSVEINSKSTGCSQMGRKRKRTMSRAPKSASKTATCAKHCTGGANNSTHKHASKVEATGNTEQQPQQQQRKRHWLIKLGVDDNFLELLNDMTKHLMKIFGPDPNPKRCEETNQQTAHTADEAVPEKPDVQAGNRDGANQQAARTAEKRRSCKKMSSRSNKVGKRGVKKSQARKRDFHSRTCKKSVPSSNVDESKRAPNSKVRESESYRPRVEEIAPYNYQIYADLMGVLEPNFKTLLELNKLHKVARTLKDDIESVSPKEFDFYDKKSLFCKIREHIVKEIDGLLQDVDSFWAHYCDEKSKDEEERKILEKLGRLGAFAAHLQRKCDEHAFFKPHKDVFNNLVLFLNLTGYSYVFVRCIGDKPGPLYHDKTKDSYPEFEKEIAKLINHDKAEGGGELEGQVKKFMKQMEEEQLYTPKNVGEPEQAKLMNCIKCFKLSIGEALLFNAKHHIHGTFIPVQDGARLMLVLHELQTK